MNSRNNADLFAKRLENALDNPGKSFAKMAAAAILINVLWVLFVAAVVVGVVVAIVKLV